LQGGKQFWIWKEHASRKNFRLQFDNRLQA